MLGATTIALAESVFQKLTLLRFSLAAPWFARRTGSIQAKTKSKENGIANHSAPAYGQSIIENPTVSWNCLLLSPAIVSHSGACGTADCQPCTVGSLMRARCEWPFKHFETAE